MKRFAACAALAYVCLILLAHGAAAEDRAIEAVGVVPDKAERSAIVAVDGYAQLSEEKTIKEIRSMAFSNAKRQALEHARTFIQSKTKVKNFELEYDLVKSEAAGYVTLLEQKDIGIEKNSRYHVWIKAEVKYALRPSAKTVEMDPEAPLTVKVWTEKKKYKKNEYITIHLHANRDFYGRIVNLTSTGRIIQLLPNDFRSDNLFRGNKTYIIPGPRDRFELKVTPPFGKERIIVYASESPTGEVRMRGLGAGLRSFEGNIDELSRGVRAISVAESSPKEMGAEFYEAAWELTTEP